jgi:bifunctional UDP-N-acetylglucosamine pyrophosphorylase/glucosamine-1-phosphate N-acetyltransferase
MPIISRSQAVILAAGQSKRFNTGRTKLLEPICGQAMILYPAQLLHSLHIPTCFVVGHQAGTITAALEHTYPATFSFARQEIQRGTADALAVSSPYWNQENILVLNGDMPLITTALLEKLFTTFQTTNAAVSFVTAHLTNPAANGYGIVKSLGNGFEIIEAKEYTEESSEACCINAGIYLFKRSFLEQYLPIIQASATTQEYYLTDLIRLASQAGLTVTTIAAPFDTIRGVNTLKELWAAEQIKRSELISYWMEQGVRFFAAQNCHIDVNVTIGRGSLIGNGVHVINGSVIGSNCNIEGFTMVSNSIIGDNVTVFANSFINNAHIESNCTIGPFAHVDVGAHLKPDCTIGNFVQVKKTTMGPKSKAKHLAFLGNATIGSRVNIGAGTITCNYDGHSRHETVIRDQAFVGSNSTLIAPVTIGQESFIAAGSVITKEVPAESLAIARAQQVNKTAYAPVLKQRAAQAATTRTSRPNETPTEQL